ncbi:hypothetical protein ACFYUR_18860 [Micromonospora haikouensis]|uniref:hypothetical protein n=1 Tax=Micromonospora haikouensis TaxID=686309 RepID=UPI0036AAC5B5
MSIDRIANEIRRAYGTHVTVTYRGAWMSFRTLAERTDLTAAQIADGVRYLAQTDLRCTIAPESNQVALTSLDRELAVRYGGQDNHLIAWS